jgi:serine/threonine-protein kinase
VTTLVNVGETLAGKYRVDRVLGIGGMGMVVAATHVELDQRVAIKFMLPDAAQNQFVAERFVREARSAVRLKSEHICRVTDYGKLDTGAPYIVMELMEGQDLSALLLRRGALPVEEAVDFVLQALEGLADAHGNGIIHRDLKPGNLFLTQTNDGAPLVKVLDFGISKSTIGGAATRTGDIMGSPAYMAPEQMMSAKNVDARADIWAIGVILYQVLTGKMPWESESLPALCMMVMNEAAPSPADVRAGLPPALAAVVLRCLEKTREARFGSVAELAAALVPFGGEEAHKSARRVTRVLGKATVSTGAVDGAIVDDRSAPVTAGRGTPMPATGLGAGSGVAPTAGVPSNMAPTAALGPMHTPAQPIQTMQPLPMHATSTMSRSAGEIALPRDVVGGKPAKRGRGVAIAAAVAGIGLVAVIVAAVATNGNGGSSGAASELPSAVPTAPAATQPAAQPAPVATQPAAAPATPPATVVTPPPPVQTPPEQPTTPAQPVIAPAMQAGTDAHKPPAFTPAVLHTSTHAPATGPVTHPGTGAVTTTPPTTTPPTVTPPATTPPATTPATTPPATNAGSGNMWGHMQHDKTNSGH